MAIEPSLKINNNAGIPFPRFRRWEVSGEVACHKLGGELSGMPADSLDVR
ncbi:MAG: hypothetical protein ACREPW_00575 [Candidatus Binataceae bacterium]